MDAQSSEGSPPRKKMKQPNQSNTCISAYFKPLKDKNKEKQSVPLTKAHAVCSDINSTVTANDPKSETENVQEEVVTSTLASESGVFSSASACSYKLSNDISVAFTQTKDGWELIRSICLSDRQKFELLTNHIVPDDSFKWPYGCKPSQKVFLSKAHITGKNASFKYSFILKGVLCVPCVIFGCSEVANDRGKMTELGSFVTKPFHRYEKINDRIKEHLKNNYHKHAQEKADYFIRTIKNPASRVDVQVNEATKQLVVENRKRLVPIVKTIIFCGRLGIALRGHRDDGQLNHESAIKGLEGNFRALLAFRVDSGDDVLKEHLSVANKKATYISKVSQNVLINLCGDEILQHIVKEIKTAKFFAIIADETADSSGHEQLCLCLRYVHKNNDDIKIKEEFVGFIAINDLTAQSIANAILQKVADLEIDIGNCVGQGYDGAASMSGHVSGVQSRIREQAPLATYVHCASHCLNLVLSSSSQVTSVRNMFTAVADIINFFNSSSKRRRMLGTNLITYCDTRFVQRHDAIIRFVNNFDDILTVLHHIAESSTMDSASKTKAFSLASVVTTSVFLVALSAAKKVLALTVTLSRCLQSSSLELAEGNEMIQSVTKRLQEWRLDDSSWSGGEYSVFAQVEQLALTAGVVLLKPRLAGRQQHRVSQTSTDETTGDYFKRSIWLPYLDSVIVHMQDKFSPISKTAMALPSLLMSKQFEEEKFKETFALYGRMLDCSEEELYYELLDYTKFIRAGPSNITHRKDDQEEEYSTVKETLSILEIISCLHPRFVKLNKLLHIAATLPVTSCSAERCFSAMKLLKSRIRSTMDDERLNGLALMCIHNEVNIPVESVINKFALSKRKVDFVL